MAKISIVVPVYKVEKYIERCINSILNQTFTNFELILVNDGSPDRCGAICNDYSKRDKRIKVIHKKNEGLSAARNAGIKVATGEYIAFVDSDDFINKNMYKVLYENAIKYDADISMCQFKYIYPNDVIDESLEFYSGEVLIYNNIQALEMLYKEKRLQFIVAWNKLYKKKLFCDISYDYGRTHEDEFIIHKLLYKSNRITFSLEEMYYYLQREGSIMKSNFSEKNLDILDALINRMNFFEENNLKELYFETQNNYIYFFFDYYFKVKNQLKNEITLKNIKKQFRMIFKSLLKNRSYNKKAKILWFIFLVNPFMYYYIINNIMKSNKCINY